MKHSSIVATVLLVFAMPIGAFAATCDTSLSDIHITRARGSTITEFKALVSKGACEGRSPSHLRVFSGQKVVLDIPMPPLAPGGSAPVSGKIPADVDPNSLQISTVDASHSMMSPATQLVPIVKSTPVASAFSGGFDIRPQSMVLHVSRAAVLK